MKSVLTLSILIALIAFPISQLMAVEVAPRISDREIIESLSEIKANQKAMNHRFEAIDQRFKSLEKSIDHRFNSIDQRLSEQHLTMLAMFGGIMSLMVALFAYIAWDRRTMFKPMQEKLDRIERDLEHDLEIAHSQGSRVTRMMGALREIAKTESNVDKALKNFSL